MSRRSYSGNAQILLLTGPITDIATSLPVSGGAGWPTGANGPFSAVISRGTSAEEKILCSALSGGFLTVIRGYDGTSAVSHNANEPIQHITTSIDADEANAHVNASVNVHGITGGDRLVGEQTAATLRNKTIDGGQNTLQNIPRTAVPGYQSDITNLQAADTAEATARQNADTALQTNITNETNARTSADSTLSAADTTEQNARIAADALKADASAVYTKAQVDAKLAALGVTAIASGVVSVTLSAAPSGSAAVTFPVGRFSSAPNVVASCVTTSTYIASPSASTATGVTINAFHRDGTSTSVTVSVYWIAVL